MECSLCLEDFNSEARRPVVFQCGHSSCAHCAQRLVNIARAKSGAPSSDYSPFGSISPISSFECPHCRSSIPIPLPLSGSASSELPFPTNYSLLELVEALRALGFTHLPTHAPKPFLPTPSALPFPSALPSLASLASAFPAASSSFFQLARPEPIEATPPLALPLPTPSITTPSLLPAPSPSPQPPAQAPPPPQDEEEGEGEEGEGAWEGGEGEEGVTQDFQRLCFVKVNPNAPRFERIIQRGPLGEEEQGQIVTLGFDGESARVKNESGEMGWYKYEDLIVIAPPPPRERTQARPDTPDESGSGSNDFGFQPEVGMRVVLARNGLLERNLARGPLLENEIGTIKILGWDGISANVQAASGAGWYRLHDLRPLNTFQDAAPSLPSSSAQGFDATQREAFPDLPAPSVRVESTRARQPSSKPADSESELAAYNSWLNSMPSTSSTAAAEPPAPAPSSSSAFGLPSLVDAMSGDRRPSAPSASPSPSVPPIPLPLPSSSSSASNQFVIGSVVKLLRSSKNYTALLMRGPLVPGGTGTVVVLGYDKMSVQVKVVSNGKEAQGWYKLTEIELVSNPPPSAAPASSFSAAPAPAGAFAAFQKGSKVKLGRTADLEKNLLKGPLRDVEAMGVISIMGFDGLNCKVRVANGEEGWLKLCDLRVVPE